MHRRYSRQDDFIDPDSYFDFEEESRHTTRRRFGPNRPEPAIPHEAPEIIGSFYQPIARGRENGIQTPRIPNPRFELSQGLVNSMQRNRFSGDSDQNPLDHLQLFDRFCDMYRMEGIPLNTIKMMAFPISLDGAANVWQSEMPSKSVSTWEDIKKEFLIAFFPREKTLELRRLISDFKQGKDENFSRCWGRFRGYLLDCPHHGFSESNLLGTFYNGCQEKFRIIMDTSSGGSFSDLTVKEGEVIINKMIKNWRGRYAEDDKVFNPPSESGCDASNERHEIGQKESIETEPNPRETT